MFSLNSMNTLTHRFPSEFTKILTNFASDFVPKFLLANGHSHR